MLSPRDHKTESFSSNRRVPNYPEGTFSEINAAAIDSMAGVSTQTLCERLATAQQRLRALYQKIPDASVAFKKGGAERKLPQAFTRMEQHIRGHFVGLKRQLRSSLRQVSIDRAIYLVDDILQDATFPLAAQRPGCDPFALSNESRTSDSD